MTAVRGVGWMVPTKAETRTLLVPAIAPVFSALDAVRAAQAVRLRD